MQKHCVPRGCSILAARNIAATSTRMKFRLKRRFVSSLQISFHFVFVNCVLIIFCIFRFVTLQLIYWFYVTVIFGIAQPDSVLFPALVTKHTQLSEHDFIITMLYNRSFIVQYKDLRGSFL